MKVSVIIPAAGSGSRMGSDEKKQYMQLLGKEILIHTLSHFQDHQGIDEVVVVTNEDELERCKTLINAYGMTKVKKVVSGGWRRQDSIYNALMAVSEDTDYVMVHDAARPFIGEKIITENIEGVQKTGGVVTAVPTKDTIKVVEGHRVSETLDRSKLINVQTPQTFAYQQLLKAYDYMRQHGLDVTDDSALIEKIGLTVDYVMGSYSNIKITTPEDLIYGEVLLKRGGE